MRKQTFVKTFSILLLSCLVLGTIPFVLAANVTDALYDPNDAWIDSEIKYSDIIYNEKVSIVPAFQNGQWDTLSMIGDKLIVDSQAAIDASNSYEVTSDLKSIKDKYNFAMEQAKQMGIYSKKVAEEGKNGNMEAAKSDYNKIGEYAVSFNKNMESVADQLLAYITIRHEGRMNAIDALGGYYRVYHPV